MPPVTTTTTTTTTTTEVNNFTFSLQGGLVSSKISGVGTNIGLLVHLLSGPKKQRAC
jgi:hypothetical protein